MPILSGWRYRKDLTIYKPAGYTVDDYIHVVIVSFESGKMNSDFSDIRFTLQDKYTLLAHWRADGYVASSRAIFYVLIGNLTVDTTIYRYYGNTSASTASDKAATFTHAVNFCEDFNTDLSNWTQSEPANTSIDIIDSSYLQVSYTGGGSGHAECTSTGTHTVPKEIRFRGRVTSSTPRTYTETRGGVFDSGTGNYALIGRTTTGVSDAILFNYDVYGGSHLLDTDDDVYSGSTWYDFRIEWWANKVNFYVYDYGTDTETLEATVTNADVPDGPLNLYFDANCWWGLGQGVCTICADYIAVRNICEDPTDPVTDAWGSEEEFSLDKVRIQLGVTPYEEVTDHGSNTHKVLAGEVNKFFTHDFYATDVNLVLDGEYNGYEAKAPYFIEAVVNGGGALSSLTEAKLVLLINTGRTYSTSSVLGDKADYSLKVMSGSDLLAVLKEREPFYLKDNNAGIDPSGINIETVEHDGSNIASGTGLGVKQLILQ